MIHLPRATKVALRACSLGLAVSVAVAAPVLADHEPPTISLAPVGQNDLFFDLEMSPGESRELEVDLSNSGHTEVVARTYAADAYSIIGGGFGAEVFGEDPSGTTLWLDYRTRQISIEPGEGLTIGFTVSVPDGTLPGQYITSVVAENAEPYSDPEGGEGIQFEQVNRTAIAVAIEVPGPRTPSLEIGAVGHKSAAGMSFVTFEVLNTGNVHLKPAGEFVLRNAEGEQIATYEPVMDSVYAGTQTLLEAPLSNELRPGRYCAELRLVDEETGASAETECMPFSVADPTDEGNGDGGAGEQSIPVIQPVIDAAAARDPRVLGAGLILLAALGTIALLLVRSRTARLARERRHR